MPGSSCRPQFERGEELEPTARRPSGSVAVARTFGDVGETSHQSGRGTDQSMKKRPMEMGRSEVHANTAKVCNLLSRGTTTGTNLGGGTESQPAFTARP